MAQDSSIEWTESTWNPVTGCTKISPGCKHCYAERMAVRLAGMKQPRYRNGFDVTLHPDLVRLPLRWRQPRTIFVNSMSDLFHADIPESFIAEMKGFIEAIRNDTETPVMALDGRKPILIAMAANKSLKENRPVKLSEIE